MPPKAETVQAWLGRVAGEWCDAIAICAVNRQAPLTFGGLEAHCGEIGDSLRAAGIGSRDVVMLALGNGPEALTAILGVASHAIALLAPAQAAISEYALLLDEIDVRAVLMDERPAAPLAALAAARGIAVMHARRDWARAAGVFRPRLVSGGAGGAGSSQLAPPSIDDLALLVPTAGTTAVPKIVGLSHASIYASISYCADWLGLGPDDRSLVVTPLNHLHAVLRSALPVLLRGGSVACAPGFDAGRLPEWLDTCRPTLMTAVPAMWRMILRHAANTGWRPDRHGLRLLAVGSDTIDDDEIRRVEQAFAAPLSQFYGLSETSPLIAVSPADREALPAGVVGHINPVWSVATVDDDGRQLPVGEEGEIAVVGGIVNPLVGRSSAGRQRLDAGRRLLTGDLGRLGSDGTLTLTGRVGERIHRGGKKIVPSAVEAALARHPDVQEVAAFPIRDAVLGQRVGAIAVPAPGTTPDVTALAAFAAEHLASHEVPELIRLASTIPRNEVGKVARALLAATLGIDTITPPAAPAGPVPYATAPADNAEIRHQLLRLFARRLKLDAVDPDATFEGLGGDSLTAVELLVDIEDALGISVPPAIFMHNSSVAALSQLLHEDWQRIATDILVPVETRGTLSPLFIAHNLDGTTSYAHALSGALGPEQPVYTFQSRPLAGGASHATRMKSLAARYVSIMRQVQPEGPYYLLGYSFGGQLALEMAQQLFRDGEPVAFLGIINDEADLATRHYDTVSIPTIDLSAGMANRVALVNYVTEPYPGAVTLLRATGASDAPLSDRTLGWGELALGGFDAIDVEGDHYLIISGEAISRWGPRLGALLARARHGARADREILRRKALAAAAAAREHATLPAVHHAIEARRAVRVGDLQRETAHLRAAIAADTGAGTSRPWLHLSLARSLLDQKLVLDALEASTTAATVDPWPLPAYTLSAILLKALDRQGEVAPLISAARALSARHAGIQLQLAEFYEAAGAYEEGISAARLGLAIAPSDWRFEARLASIAGRQGRTIAASEHLERVIVMEPGLSGNYCQLGELYLRQKRTEEAGAQFRRALELDQWQVDAWIGLSHVHLHSGRRQEAIEAAERAIAIEPRRRDWWAHLDALKGRAAI